MISIITATFNSQSCISRLISSLENQTCKEFEWIVVDNLSTDATVTTITNSTINNVKTIVEQDYGIYDAINKGIRAAIFDYYLVVGSDDYLELNAIDVFLAHIPGGNDAITARLMFGNKVRGPKGGPLILNKQFKYFSSHSVGTVFKKKLHTIYGFYNTQLRIASDQEFMLKVALNNSSRILSIPQTVGTFTKSGVSSSPKHTLCTLYESYTCLLPYVNKHFLSLIYILKLIKNYKRI